jgi:hypothetical protein
MTQERHFATAYETTIMALAEAFAVSIRTTSRRKESHGRR